MITNPRLTFMVTIADAQSIRDHLIDNHVDFDQWVERTFFAIGVVEFHTTDLDAVRVFAGLMTGETDR